MRKILVVEDSKTYLNFVSALLGKAGYQVLTSNNGWVADIVNRERPDLILMDVQLGAVSGVAAVGALRKRSFCQNTSIILHSSEPAPQLAEMAASCGANGFLQKDGNEAHVLRAVKQALADRAAAAAV